MKIIKINAMWCSACISMHKIWNDIEKNYPEFEIISYDYDLKCNTLYVHFSTCGVSFKHSLVLFR